MDQRKIPIYFFIILQWHSGYSSYLFQHFVHLVYKEIVTFVFSSFTRFVAKDFCIYHTHFQNSLNPP